MPYRIVRHHQNLQVPARKIKSNLTIEEAQEHCNNPETSAATCKKKSNIRYTEKYGNWMDVYYKY